MIKIYNDIITPIDFLIGPIVLFILYAKIRKDRNKLYKNTPLYGYYQLAFTLRVIGCILSACMYQYYYHGGDTFAYYHGTISIWNILWDNPSLLYEAFTGKANEFSFELYNYFRETNATEFLHEESTYMVLKIGGLIGLFTFKSYLSIGFVLTYFSFRGCWLMFLTFSDLYPKLHKQIAISTLFIPSVFFWGAAGLMKDTITMACIGYMTFHSYQIFLKGKIRISSILKLLVCFYLTFIIKAYIIIAFLPALFVWIFFSYESKIRNKYLKILARPIFICFAFLMVMFFYQVLSSGSKRYSEDALLGYVEGIQGDHSDTKRGGRESAYTLGHIELTPIGILKKVPAAINVALFRPYLWELRKPIFLPSALEGFLSLLFSLFIFYKVGIIQTIKNLFSDPNVLFCMTFSLIFAFAVGFTSFNFGALARFKIPAIPFYFLSLVILHSKIKKKPKKMLPVEE
jgi:hypothetical protein